MRTTTTVHKGDCDGDCGRDYDEKDSDGSVEQEQCQVCEARWMAGIACPNCSVDKLSVFVAYGSWSRGNNDSNNNDADSNDDHTGDMESNDSINWRECQVYKAHDVAGTACPDCSVDSIHIIF